MRVKDVEFVTRTTQSRIVFSRSELATLREAARILSEAHDLTEGRRRDELLDPLKRAAEDIERIASEGSYECSLRPLRSEPELVS